MSYSAGFGNTRRPATPAASGPGATSPNPNQVSQTGGGSQAQGGWGGSGNSYNMSAGSSSPFGTAARSGAVFGSGPQMPQAPSMPFDFNALLSGLMGAGGGGGHGGGPPPPQPNLPDPTDMTERNLTAARDSGTSAMKEYQTGLTARMGPGATAPAASARIGSETLRNMNRGALDAQQQEYAQRVQAYQASLDAWRAGSDADIARRRMDLDRQIAAINAALGMWGTMGTIMGQMGGLMGSAAGGGGAFG